ncbi:hypothetical protein I6F18_29935 [Bradyrhizobium sp. NBAIM32]|uniref:RNase H family protein n=1 Tax=Bradyrhizobium sp. NBAIM32 TaxID=2793809 RepID=UPI001CD70EB6|nr:RNase H family protein [Bradyrhizobium sp. NBAIM32]MCA1544165.1 hypothetical protein [Bradyrhizobium sp. NBAIM32]
MKRTSAKKLETMNALVSPEPSAPNSGLPFPEGHSFVATIFALDQRTALPSTAVPAAYAIAFQHDESDQIVDLRCAPVEAVVSSQNEGLILATLQVIDLAPNSAAIKLRSSGKFIVDGLNEDRHRWKRNVWKKSNGKDLTRADCWKKIDSLILTKNLKVEGYHVPSREAESNLVFEVLRTLATGERDRHGREIGAPLSGFSSEE